MNGFFRTNMHTTVNVLGDVTPLEIISSHCASATEGAKYLAKRSHLLATLCNVENGVSSLYIKLVLLDCGVFNYRYLIQFFKQILIDFWT